MSHHPSPFDRLHADAWSNDFADVPSLNGPVSDALVASIDAIRRAARAGGESLRSPSVLVLGPAGSGKTHLFARLRRKCGPKAAFVLLRPELGIDPTPRHVLAACVDALQQRVAGRDERQLDFVVGSAGLLLGGAKQEFPTVVLDELRGASAAEREEWIGNVIEKIEANYPGVDVSWLERFLGLPFASRIERQAALAWLSGREPSDTQLARLGVRDSLGGTSVVPALRSLTVLAAYSTPLVLVFDQLENLVDEDGTERRIRAHGNLVSELHDSVKGLVIVQLALDAEWQRRIYPGLSESQKSRLAENVEHLALPTAQQRDQLIGAWVERLPANERKPRPWPFSADAWERWRTGLGVTPRMLMIACREAVEHGPDVAPPAVDAGPDDAEPVDDRLEELWNDQLDLARAALDDAHRAGRPLDAQHIASGIAAALSLVPDADVHLPPAKAEHTLRLNTASEEVDLFVVQSGHPKSAATALQRATGATAERRVVAVRQAAHAFPPTWKVVAQHVRTMLDTRRVQWVELSRDEVVQLLAVHDLLAAARSQDLTARDGRPLDEAVVRAWAQRTLDVARWRALEALLAPQTAASDVADAPSAVYERPRPAPDGGIAPTPGTPRISDEAGVREGVQYREWLLAVLESLGAPLPLAKPPVVGASLVRIEVSMAKGRVTWIDKAKQDVIRKLASEHELAARYEKRGGLRVFTIARKSPRTVALTPLLAAESAWLTEKPGRFLLGEAVDGRILKGDLGEPASCHLLVGGAKRSGKSALLSAIVASLAHSHGPSAIRFTLVDPTRATFAKLAASLAAHLVGPVCDDVAETQPVLDALVDEMEERYSAFEEARVEDIDEHNAIRGVEVLARRVVIVDEFQDLLASKATREPFLTAIRRLGPKARAAGIHLILATERLTKENVPGTVKANLPGKVALKTANAHESRTILGFGGAEALLGHGDFYTDLGHGPERGQGPLA